MLLKQLNFDRLLAKTWEEMGLVRVYTKPQGQQPDFSDPVVLSAVCCMPLCLSSYLSIGSFIYAWKFPVFFPFLISILSVFDFRIEVAALLKTSVITYIEVW